ncbi:MAG: hypothetical protein KQI78_21310 [Deltaproteobacteria bacterium]|jgi:hypothetical protein|nr:hypothetical protein [Deltaproteobacteria bacterium]
MKRNMIKFIFVLALAVAGWMWSGDFRPPSRDLVATAEAIIGRPMTPLSYAGVARRTTVRAATYRRARW